MDLRTRPYGWRPAAVLALLPLLAACGGGHDEDGPARGAAMRIPSSDGTELVIRTDNGVRLRPADDDRVGVDERVRTDWSHRDGTWVLDLSCPGHDGGSAWADRPDGGRDGGSAGGACPRTPEVTVPAGTAVTVSARNAGIDAAGVSGALDLTTVNGDVTVDRSGARDAVVRLATRNGSVRAGGLLAARLHARTVNGDVVLGCGTAPSGVGAATTNGSVRVTVPHDAPAYRVTATTDNGGPTVSVPTTGAEAGREMTLSTVNGDVTAAAE